MADTFTRRGLAGPSLGGLAGLAGCGAADPATERLPLMGDFRLVQPITVAANAKKVPPSRDASEDELKRAMNDALRRRFESYQGARGYYVAVAIDGYSLARPGIPILLAPKSILVVSANLWSADPQEKLAGPEQLSVFEDAGSALLGSGLTRDADAQLGALARNMARRIQSWLLETPETFGLSAA